MESQLHIKFDNIRSETKTEELENTFSVAFYNHNADRLPNGVASYSVAGDRFMSNIHPVQVEIPAVRGGGLY